MKLTITKQSNGSSVYLSIKGPRQVVLRAITRMFNYGVLGNIPEEILPETIVSTEPKKLEQYFADTTMNRAKRRAMQHGVNGHEAAFNRLAKKVLDIPTEFGIIPRHSAEDEAGRVYSVSRGLSSLKC